MDEEGGNSAGEEDENLLNVEEGQEMDVDNPGAAPGGEKQVGGTQQGGKEKLGVPLTDEERLEREMRRKRRAEKKKEELERKRILLEKAREAKQQGREAGGRAKVDHRYYAVRSLRGARPAGRELNRQAVVDRTVEKTIGHVLEDGFLGGGGREMAAELQHPQAGHALSTLGPDSATHARGSLTGQPKVEMERLWHSWSQTSHSQQMCRPWGRGSA
jgi:hypothetical protein